MRTPWSGADYPRVTCGPNWFGIRKKRLEVNVNGRDYAGPPAKVGRRVLDLR